MTSPATPEVRAPEPAPVLLTSLASSVLLDGRGDLALERETRGASIEWGGVYAQLVRLTGPWRIEVAVDHDLYELPATRVDSAASEGRWTSRHRLGRVDLLQEVVAVEDPPGALRRLRFVQAEGPPARVRVLSRFAPYLLPVLVEGVLPTSFHLEKRSEELRVRQHGFALRYSATVLPSQLFVNRSAWDGGHYEGRVDELGSDHEVEVAVGAPTEIRFLLSGGLERDAYRTEEPGLARLDPDALARHAVEAETTWAAAVPEMVLPDAPDLEQGYRLARTALHRLYSAPGDGLVGLVAGYPWYSALWCRDLAWMLPAVVWLGDWEWAERSVASVLRFQSHSEVPILGGEPGELPMQVAPGPLFFYGTSDTTLYYPDLVRRLVRHAGRSDLVPAWGTAVARMIAWGRARADPDTGLVRNGGEAEAISAATGSLARVRYGIDSPDTTIWDSTDRRDHAIDVQVLWYEALGAAAELLADGPEDPRSESLRHSAARVADAIRSRYRWVDAGYLYDSLRAGAPVAKLRPNALRAVSAGLMDAATAREIVRRVAREDLSTPWGVRTLSDRDPGYDPRAYHDGQVWTIATAWAADAALVADERELGRQYLGTIAELIAKEGGLANECYRGDRAEPFDSCFLLGFSVAPFLTVLFERLWGLDVDGRAPGVAVRPKFPSAWRSATLDRLRVGPGHARFDWAPGRLRVRWSGPGPLEVRTEGETATLDAGGEREFALPSLGGSSGTPSLS